MNLRKHGQLFFTLSALWVALCSQRAEATLLNPSDFASLGAFPNDTTRDYTINTSGTPSFTGPGITGTLNGVVFAPDDIAVFTFDGGATSSITINVTGIRPLALLFQGDVSYTGTLFTANPTPLPDKPAVRGCAP